MGTRLNKAHQVFNIFLILGLICAVAAVFLFFFTKAEQRNVTFWISIGVLVLAGVIDALFAARLVFSDDDRQPPHAFTQLLLTFIYTAVVLALSVVNAFAQFSTVNYFLIHVGAGVIFLLPLQLVNMAAVKSGGAKAVAERARNGLKDEALRVRTVMSRIESRDPKANVTKLRKLADNFLYSEPAQAPGEVEAALSKSIDELEGIAKIFMADGNTDLSVRGVLSEAVDAVDAALKARNEAILRSK